IAADWIGDPVRLLYSHVLIPGTKNTTADLAWLRAKGLDTWIQRQHAAGATVIGVCGGYQMLGQSVLEDGRTHQGLALLPVETVMRADKTVRQVAGTLNGTPFDAYEIHVGQTTTPLNAVPFAFVDGRPEGIRYNRCIGTYLHDALRADCVLAELGLAAEPAHRPDASYDQLAEWFAAHADIRLFEDQYL
ncbi:MAG TPA: hypothetical protein VES20_17185, partial [Bryobacteraceae bacterium]|nr:hypothetical protein [Bryobacteraceae bacterium]